MKCNTTAIKQHNRESTSSQHKRAPASFLDHPWSGFVWTMLVECFHSGGVGVVLGQFPCGIGVARPFDIVLCAPADDLGVQDFLNFVFFVGVEDDCRGGAVSVVLRLGWLVPDPVGIREIRGGALSSVAMLTRRHRLIELS